MVTIPRGGSGWAPIIIPMGTPSSSSLAGCICDRQVCGYAAGIRGIPGRYPYPRPPCWKRSRFWYAASSRLWGSAGLPPRHIANGFRNKPAKYIGLPTEAEWEKACRGGLENAAYAWVDESIETIEYFRGDWNSPGPVGQGPRKVVTGYSTWATMSTSGASIGWRAVLRCLAGTESQRTGDGSRRVSRGGSWRHQLKASRAAHRSSLPPGYAYTITDFESAGALSKSIEEFCYGIDRTRCGRC
jgi:formylglycine-generating enzyme required for sulfatase activity